jgi:hypothetical protein
MTRQLNKGESLHALRAYLTVANKGILKRRQDEHLRHQLGCLNLLTNAVIVWNTVYMWEAVKQLKAEGYPVLEEDLAHIWGSRFEHINVYGRYEFNVKEAKERKGLRELRQPGDFSLYR